MLQESQSSPELIWNSGGAGRTHRSLPELCLWITTEEWLGLLCFLSIKLRSPLRISLLESLESPDIRRAHALLFLSRGFILTSVGGRTRGVSRGVVEASRSGLTPRSCPAIVLFSQLI
ncbi:hypothetical protein DPEC_G00378770 [Dallia pectoralis]|nr:hypothetical protein DPEC_G00378770 [Dallia pectoralis]